MPIFLGYVVSYDAVICLRVSVMEAPLHILLSYVYGLRGGAVQCDGSVASYVIFDGRTLPAS